MDALCLAFVVAAAYGAVVLIVAAVCGFNERR